MFGRLELGIVIGTLHSSMTAGGLPRPGGGLMLPGMRSVLSALRRVLVMIGSLVAAGLVVSMFVVPWLRAATGTTDPGRDAGISTVVTIVIVVLGGLIYRDILRSEGRGTHETTPTSSGG